MKEKSVLFISLVIAIGLLLLYLTFLRYTPRTSRDSNNQSMLEEAKKGGWVYTSEYGLQFWIALNKFVDSPPGDGIRTIVLFIEEKYFNEDTLRELFTGLAEKYKQPRELSIYAYSNERRTTEAVQYQSFPPIGHPSNTNKPLDQSESKNGHLQAHYYRSRVYVYGLREEWFEYTPNANTNERIKITLKSEKLKK